MECCHDDPKATMDLFGFWHWTSSEFQVDGKDGAIVSRSGRVSERKITPKHLVRGYCIMNLRYLAEVTQSNVEAVHSKSFFASETWGTCQEQFRNSQLITLVFLIKGDVSSLGLSVIKHQ